MSIIIAGNVTNINNYRKYYEPLIKKDSKNFKEGMKKQMKQQISKPKLKLFQHYSVLNLISLKITLRKIYYS